MMLGGISILLVNKYEIRFGFSDSAELEAKGPEFRSLRSVGFPAVGGCNLSDRSEKTFSLGMLLAMI